MASNADGADPIKMLAIVTNKLKDDPSLGRDHVRVASMPTLFPDEGFPKKGVSFSVQFLNDSGAPVGKPVWVISRLRSLNIGDESKKSDLEGLVKQALADKDVPSIETKRSSDGENSAGEKPNEETSSGKKDTKEKVGIVRLTPRTEAIVGSDKELVEAEARRGA